MENHFKDRYFLFWQKWLFYTSLIFALFGIIFAFGGESFVFQAYDKMLAGVFWQTTQFPAEAKSFRSFIAGPFGGTIACCYILLAYIAAHPFKEKQIWARNAIIIAFGVWAIIDSTICIYYKVYFQVALINSISILVKALPLVFTWKYFGQKKHNVWRAHL